MYSGFIVKAGEVTGNDIIDVSIVGFKYSNIDVICIMQDETVSAIETVETVRIALQVEDGSLEELKDQYIKMLNDATTQE